MGKDLDLKLLLTKEEIIHLYQGGVLSLKIKGKDSLASVEISCKEASDHQRRRIRFKTIELD